MKKRVLITKLSSLGDLVLALPALSDAAKAIPNIEFDWIVDRNFSEIPLWHPSVRHLFITNHRLWRKNLFSKETKQEFSEVYKALKNQTYDLIIDAQGNIKSGFFACMAQGKRAGWDGSSTPEWGSQFFYNISYKVSKKLHATQRIRELFAHSLNYDLPTSAPDYGVDLSRLKKPKVDLPSSYLIFVPIASHDSKLWPEKRWKELIEKTDHTVLLPWGNFKEKERAQRLASKNTLILPRLSLNEIGFLLKEAKAVLSVDTGLSHMSAALSTPCVTLYGPTKPSLTGTVGENQYWIESKTSSLEDISISEVEKALFSILAK